jgi:choline dehydrogenase-like flavoprotein
MTGFGEMLPHHDNTIRLDRDRKDKWGLPVLAMDVSMRANELAMRKDMAADAAEMLEAAGVKDVKMHDNDYAPGKGIHEMGTARMGRDRKSSVLNAQPGLGCAQRLCDRRCLHDLQRLRESFADLWR